MDKIRVIKLSLRCRRCGIAGLIPVIGLPFLIIAQADYRRVRREVGKEWNPAGRQLFWGHTLVIIGWGLDALTVGVLLVAMFNASR